MKQVKVEWCENFIRTAFGPRHHAFADRPHPGIETGCFWKMAERSGLWERDTYSTPMSEALGRLTTVETIHDENGKYLYDVFRLA